MLDLIFVLFIAVFRSFRNQAAIQAEIIAINCSCFNEPNRRNGSSCTASADAFGFDDGPRWTEDVSDVQSS
jgi:hypothetical protein